MKQEFFLMKRIFSHLAKAAVYPSGAIVWDPPMIYKSSCPINVQYFPFGEAVIHEQTGVSFEEHFVCL